MSEADDRVERAAIALVIAVGQDWPIEQPDWAESVAEHWRDYKASWREAARKMLAAADDPDAMPPTCATCGADMAQSTDGRCPKPFNHPGYGSNVT